MGTYERNKGARFERAVVAEFRKIGVLARRGLQCRSGEDAPDVYCRGFSVECKDSRSLPGRRLLCAMEQAERPARPEQTPVVIMKRQGHPIGDAIVSMTFESFCALISALESVEKS